MTRFPFLLIFLFRSLDTQIFCTNWYSVESGDTCWKIANDHGLIVDNLTEWNNQLECDKLWVGQKICIGASSKQPNCTKLAKVESGDYCYKIWTDNNLTEEEFKSYNPELDCDKLMVGLNVCIGIEVNSTSSNSTDDRNPLPMLEDGDDNCAEFAIVKQNDTCWSISNEYAVNLTKLESEYQCDLLNPGDTICVSETFFCQLRYQIIENDTCSMISDIFKTSNYEIEEYNPDVNCSKSLKVGRRICVWSTDERELANITCISHAKKPDNVFLSDFARQKSITLDELKFLNPNVATNQEYCIHSQSSVNCSSFEYVQANDTCDKIVQRNHMSMNLLMKLNPTLRCDSLNITHEICNGIGYFQSNECVNTVRIDPDNDECVKISNNTDISITKIEELNKGLNCSQKLEWSTLICTSSLGMNTQTAQQIMVDNLKNEAPGLVESYQEYLKNPNEQTSNEMNQQVVKSIIDPDVYKNLKQLYETNEDIRVILHSQAPLERSFYCEQAKKTTFSDAVKKCFCSSTELLIYCQAIGQNEYQNSMNTDFKTGTSLARRKRCAFTWPASGADIFEKTTSGVASCFGGDCTIPLGLMEASLAGDFCVPIVQITTDTVTMCIRDSNDCQSSNFGDNYLRQLTEVSTTMSGSLCIVGTRLLRVLKLAELAFCWKVINFEYAPFVGLLTISSEFSFPIFTLIGGAKIKATDIPFEGLCDMGAFECEDYCKMKAYDWPNGKAFGFIEVKLFKMLGWGGITIFDEQFNNPRILGCQAGSEAAIVLRNERTCKKENEREIQRRCWSGDDKIPWGPLEPENGFSFKPGPRTLFVCEFVDSNGQKIGFDVYGGKSKNKGKKTFFYAVKNDGIYFGRSRDDETKLEGKWDNPCEQGEDEEEQSPTESYPSDVEPTGTSSVLAAGCGKRIVGYYTGWGEREISENQLKKLTHVIFAFVELGSSQDLKFGKVSVDDSDPQSATRAEQRFLDLMKKARQSNSGVNVLFAIGGWDNSQYFSSICANSGDRSRFVQSIITFIDNYNVDGVDIDWEYPDINGKDKSNHVEFVRELRQNLEDLQNKKNRKQKYLITLATAAGEWNLRKGYDFDELLKYVDFLNIMTYDYYGAWESKWGAYTGPPSPLYYGTLDGFSGKLNADFTMKYYSCHTKQSNKLNMGIPFYGRYWDNVLGPIDGKDGMWRTAEEKNGKFEGGFVAWRNSEKNGWNKGASIWHDKTKTPYIVNSGARKFMGYENEKSIGEKIKYSIDKNVGGLMVWALDLDDDSDTLLSIVSSADLCSASGNSNYNCVPIDDVRWWTPENSDESRQGQCGKSAPLINGYYPVCDPDDPGYSCCGSAGYCGTGKDYCDCDTCVDYRKDPKLILKEPIKPTQDVQWYTMDDEDGKRGRCGKDVPQINGKIAICNPDDDSKYCCSNGGYCGIGKEFCECDGCVDYRHKK